MKKIYSAMTSLELWAFICIVSVFASLLFYAMILFKDQMIIQENIKKKPFARMRVCCESWDLIDNFWMNDF